MSRAIKSAINQQIPGDVTVIKHSKFEDKRGFLNCLAESMTNDQFSGWSLKMSHSKVNVARGIHWQRPDAPQEKVITLLRGIILDVLVNLDPNSQQFGRAYRFQINADEGATLVIPPHYGHGFLALTDTDFLYLCKGKYSSQSELSLGIFDYLQDVISPQTIILSKKDAQALPFDELALSKK